MRHIINIFSIALKKRNNKTKIFQSMNYSKLLTLAFSFFAVTLLAQVDEGPVMMSSGEHNAFTVVLENADYKRAERVWKEYTKPYGKFDRDRKRKEFRAEAINIPSISRSTDFSVTLKLNEQKNQTTAHVFFQSDGVYVDSSADPEIADNMRAFVEHFQYEVDRKVVEEMIKEEEKRLKNLHKDLSKLENRNNDLHNDIEKYEKKIVEAEEDIVDNLKSQDDKQIEIKKQTKVVEELTNKLNSIGRN